MPPRARATSPCSCSSENAPDNALRVTNNASAAYGPCMQRILAALSASLAFAVPANCGGTVDSGLYGRVVIDPAQPVCRVGVPCTAPAKDTWLTFSARGRPIVRARTNARGRYRVTLRPGTYAVRVEARVIGRGLEPTRAVVRTDRYRRVDFTIDIGIR
jgi:hypothetical protein